MRRALLAVAVACLGAAVLLGGALADRGASPGPDLVRLPAETWSYRPAGTWRRDGRQVDPPLLRMDGPQPLLIMRAQVSRAEYAACVADGVCAAVRPGPGDEPQTDVNWYDATAYAGWLSRRTGQMWRLPTDAEWQRAAAERFADDALGDASLTDRWLARYSHESEGEPDPLLRRRGGWGENSRGVADLAGNVWEWTNDCVVTGTFDAGGQVAGRDEFCGARVVEGRHRAVVVDFIRDASAGGCAAGVPPQHLGFRLVREN
ncbi:formylglycine-generating enzyme family protein [Rubellimicrobium arenae]|uniref:formylglycine-generating enzyme family protein n=1 Tax=Rubellimicrobium arenae TaxID=2817372 RepID=UPI001B30E54F|nr:SUMF1/EgtB/PvdO family nonheme iron enzyme [Rubellimicrobium arenae]